jgi:hypothetical protein
MDHESATAAYDVRLLLIFQQGYWVFGVLEIRYQVVGGTAERMGMRPVMNDARPAVQLAWPYQLVKTAPSFAMRSTLGVGCPRDAPPPE